MLLCAECTVRPADQEEQLKNGERDRIAEQCCERGNDDQDKLGHRLKRAHFQ